VRYQKIIELLTVTPADGITALAMLTVIFIGMRLLYGAWPWESRKTWYRTKPFVPVMAPPEQINSQAEELTADTDSDHFDRKLIAPDQFCFRGENPPTPSQSSDAAIYPPYRIELPFKTVEGNKREPSPTAPMAPLSGGASPNQGSNNGGSSFYYEQMK
jgi:hypothetical protein